MNKHFVYTLTTAAVVFAKDVPGKRPATGFQEVFHNNSNHFELWVILHASFVLIVLYTARKLFIKAKLPF